MRALLEAMLLYKHQSLYDTYIVILLVKNKQTADVKIISLSCDATMHSHFAGLIIFVSLDAVGFLIIFKESIK